jgi:hypothetical protein
MTTMIRLHLRLRLRLRLHFGGWRTTANRESDQIAREELDWLSLLHPSSSHGRNIDTNYNYIRFLSRPSSSPGSDKWGGGRKFIDGVESDGLVSWEALCFTLLCGGVFFKRKFGICGGGGKTWKRMKERT